MSSFDYGFASFPVRPMHPLARSARADRIELYLVSLAVFFVPMNFLRHPDFYLTLSDIFGFFAFFFMVVNRQVPLRPFGNATPLWLSGMGLLIFGLMASSLIHNDPFRGLVVALQYFYAIFILSLLIVSRPKWQLIFLTKVFLASILLLCLFGAYLIHFDGERGTRFVSGNGRMLSFVERSNECASLIAITIPLLLFLGAERKIRGMIVLPLLIVFIYGIMLTGSNTGFFAASLAIAIFLVCSVSLKNMFWLFLAGAAVVAVLSFWGDTVLPETFQQRVLGALESGDINRAGSFVGRSGLIREALRIADHTLLLGVGGDQYRTVSAYNAPVHNVYLLLMTEGGAFAVIGLLLILAGLIGPAVMQKTTRKTWLASVCCMSVVGSFAVLINATPHIYARFWIVPVLLASGLCLAYKAQADESARG